MSELDWDDPNYIEKPTRLYDDISQDRRRSHREKQRNGSYRRNDLLRHSESMGIPANTVGRIIGRQGSNISELQGKYKVYVQVDKSELRVTVSGSNEMNIKNALRDIRRQISNEMERGGNAFDVGPRSNNNAWRRSERENCNHLERGSYDQSHGGGYNNATSSMAGDGNDSPEEGDLTGLIDWEALNKASEAAQAKRWAQSLPLTKNFYKEWPEVANLSLEEVKRMRLENNDTSVSYVFDPKEGEVRPPIPNPVWRFEHCFSDYPDLLDELLGKGFDIPTPIQAQGWPILLKGHDMIGIAQTGTGKTLAFLLPGLIHTEYQSTPRSARGGATVLVLAPTRELALQIEMEVNKYSFRGIKAVCIYGGGSRNMQITDIKRGAEIIICTPGRLNDLVNAGVIDVSTISYLVLDEADRMMDMGFEPQIRKVLIDIRPDRQTIMTSATWPPGVRRLAESYMNDPIQVNIGSLDLAATHSVRQVIEMHSDDNSKYEAITSFIKNMDKTAKIIIFCGRKARADDLSSDLSLVGFSTQCIHGNREQCEREQAIADIKSGLVRILIATDVASRGLDIEDITHVINYDLPRNIEEYVHRVGRTGRAGRKGTSISYVTREDWGMANELIKILEEANQDVPMELRNMSQRFANRRTSGNDRPRRGGSRIGGRPSGY